MNTNDRSPIHAAMVETQLHLTLSELGRACSVEVTVLEALVHEGVLTPQGTDSAAWRFDDATMSRARKALRLMRDLELNASAVALVLDLVSEIEALEAKLRRLG